MILPSSKERIWGQQWRSSPIFIVIAMGMAIFADMFLYTFIVPILPYMSETRLGLDASYTQNMSFALLSETAIVTVVLSPIVGHYADQSNSKRAWLLYSLVVALLGSLAVAAATSVVALFIGRLVQAIASAVIWVVGFATIADNIEAEHLGKAYGIMSVVMAVGTTAGPMLSGILFDMGGYWCAWSSAFATLVIDIILRLLMLERPRERKKQGYEMVSPGDDQADSEDAPFLETADAMSNASITKEKTGMQFYLVIFRHRRLVCAVVTYFVIAVLVSSFDTTLPLHVRAAFDWGSKPAGLLFMAFQGPGIMLTPLFGWIKDRVGSRVPVTIGFLSLAPLMWLVGIPGDDKFPWANEDDRGPVLYSVAVTMVGIMSALLNGTGAMETTLAVDEIQSNHPGVFGPNGGYSRALAIASMGWSIGGFIGPVLSGTVTDKIGYYEMNSILAVVCFVSSINAFVNLGARWDPERIQ